jgi:glycine cleavage system H protein
MTDAPSEKRCRIVPESDLKCVWMTAGILSYQLCERRFDCEHCPLDLAMRAHFSRGAGHEPPVAASRGSSRLAEDRRYARGHCWVKPEGAAGTVAALHRVGIEPGLAAALRVPRAVVPPTVGDTVRRGQAHLWMVTEGGTFALAAPLDGVVRAVNPVLAERPSAVATSPLEEGWLYTVEADENTPGMNALLDARAAARGYADDDRRFRAGLVRALRDSSAGAGAALADGGVALDDVVQMLGPSRYFALLCRVYG